MEQRIKLKRLFKIWPMHTVLPVVWLSKNGYSRSLIQRYVSSNWISSLIRGIIIRPDDKIEWSGYVWGLQRISSFHVGGKTALEVQGKAHFLKFKETDIFLFACPGLKLPHWLKNVEDVVFISVNTKLLPDEVGLMDYNFGEYCLKISNPARAFLEYMHVVSKFHSFDEAYHLMENLQFVSPRLMQEVLEQCTSTKVKRLVLCLAKKQNVNWYRDLDLSKIAIGRKFKEVVKDGAYDKDFLITYPHSWDRKEDEIIF